MGLQLMKWTVLFALVMLCLNSTHAAWKVGGKTRVNGPAIHTVYFLTPNNGSVSVSAQAYAGQYRNGYCQYTMIYNLGTEKIKTGDTFEIDAYLLQNMIGNGYTCLSMNYTYKQLATETIQLIYDGINYINTNPPLNEVVIL